MKKNIFRPDPDGNRTRISRAAVSIKAGFNGVAVDCLAATREIRVRSPSGSGRKIFFFTCHILTFGGQLGENVTGYRYIYTHLYSLAVQAGFYGVAVECLTFTREWPDPDSNQGSLAYRASTLTAELPSHMVSLLQFPTCLIRFVPESARNHAGTYETVHLSARSPSTDPH